MNRENKKGRADFKENMKKQYGYTSISAYPFLKS